MCQLISDKTTIYNYAKERIENLNDILPNSKLMFGAHKFLFFLILKGYEKNNIHSVFDDLNDGIIENFYDNNDLLSQHCENILHAEKLRTNYLLFDYNSIPKKLSINFFKNNKNI